MIELYYWPTPNGHKVAIFLEEAQMPYKIFPIHIGRGEQFGEDFLAIAPNNRIPAIIDRATADDVVSLFESGAILWYLAEKSGQFLPTGNHKMQAMQWLMWQMGGLGPMLGQNHHFRRYAPEQVPYAIERYTNEARRLYAVLDKQLGKGEYICGDYSIVDMACYPWVVPHESQGIDLADYANVRRWHDTMKTRAAVVRAYEKGAEVSSKPTVDEKAKEVLFGQTSPHKPPSQK